MLLLRLYWPDSTRVGKASFVVELQLVFPGVSIRYSCTVWLLHGWFLLARRDRRVTCQHVIGRYWLQAHVGLVTKRANYLVVFAVV